MRYAKLLFLFVFVALLSACHGRQDVARGSGDTVSLQYAENITIVKHDGYVEVAMLDPWKKGRVLHRYALVARADSARVGSLPSATVVYTPVQRSVVLSSPMCQLMVWLGAGDGISGVCDAGYVNVPLVRQQLKHGAVADCGNSMSPSVERIVALRPQALFVSPFENSTYGSLEQLGVPIIECADYMETSALGRAEWMKFYGMLMGKEAQADSLFAVVATNYKRLSALAATSSRQVKVVTERNYGGVWYCPGGKSSMSGLIADANGQYVFASDNHSGSLSLAPEAVIARAKDADVWLFVYPGQRPLSTGELLAEYDGYRLIKAFRSGAIYECGSTVTSYFDDLSFHPDWVLADFVRLFHPQLHVAGAQKYYKPLGAQHHDAAVGK